MRRDRKYSVEDPDCYDDDGGDDDDGDTVAGDVIGEGIGIDEDEMERFAVMRRVTPSPPPAPRQGRMDAMPTLCVEPTFNFMLRLCFDSCNKQECDMAGCVNARFR